MNRKDLRKKYIREDDLFETKVSKIKDPKMKQDIEYHALSGNCPYSRGECSPVGCKFGQDGMRRCPLHMGQGP